MSPEELKNKYASLADFLPIVYKDKYLLQFKQACTEELYDYVIILLWKIFILAQYKNIKQIREVLDLETFQALWSQGSLSGGGQYNLGNFSKESIYSYNKIDDDRILDLLGRLYDVDGNLIKKLKSLKGQRDICSHVADEILITDINNAARMADDLVVIAERITADHHVKYLSSDKVLLLASGDFSARDLTFVISDYSTKLSEVQNFDTAEKIMVAILKHKDFLSETQVKGILENSLTNGESRTYNQAIDCGYAYRFFSELLKVSYDKGVEIQSWVNFYNKLDDRQKERFAEIRQSLKQKGATGIVNPHNETFLDPEDLPF